MGLVFDEILLMWDDSEDQSEDTTLDPGTSYIAYIHPLEFEKKDVTCKNIFINKIFVNIVINNFMQAALFFEIVCLLYKMLFRNTTSASRPRGRPIMVTTVMNNLSSLSLKAPQILEQSPLWVVLVLHWCNKMQHFLNCKTITFLDLKTNAKYFKNNGVLKGGVFLDIEMNFFDKMSRGLQWLMYDQEIYCI